MNAPWPAELDDADPEVRLRRTRLALETVIARARAGTYFYPMAMVVYLALVPGARTQAPVLISTAVQAVLAVGRAIGYRRSVAAREAAPDRWRRIFAWWSATIIVAWDTFTAWVLWARGIDAVAMVQVTSALALRMSGTYAVAPDRPIHSIWSRWTRAPLIIGPALLGTRDGLVLSVVWLGHFVYSEVQCKQLNAEFWRRVVATDSLAAAHEELRKEVAMRQRAEVELRLAQKLESVGRLAAGIAHEINTPLQALLGSLEFIDEGSRDLIAIVGAYRAALPAAAQAQIDPELASDLDYLVANLPASLELATQCLDRAATIVRSVKTFAYPPAATKARVDLNESLATTLSVARHACAEVADVVTDFGELPAVQGYGGELNQAFLNLIINAVDAMAPVVEATGRRGTLGVTTRCEAGYIRVAIADTGVGIAEPLKERIFDPFFTTKEPGKGTGQGLMIAHAVITQRHGGELRCESALGQGTTFIVSLPAAA